MSYPQSPSYTLQPSSPSHSLDSTSNTPSPPPPQQQSSQPSRPYLPPLPIPTNSSYSNSHHNHFQRPMYPTSSPYQHQSPEPSPHSKSHYQHPTSQFTNGYASPATSTYSSEPGSRDEIDMMDSGSLGGSTFHAHGNLPGIDGLFRSDQGVHLEKYNSPRHDDREREYRRRWNMSDFQLIQTVGMSSLPRFG